MKPLPSDVLIPSATERRQIFYWLKRISSYTAWKRMEGYYKQWVDTIEKSWELANQRGWEKKTALEMT